MPPRSDSVIIMEVSVLFALVEPGSWLWWLQKLEENYLGLGLVAILLALAWKYSTRVIDSHINYLSVTSKSTESNTRFNEQIAEQFALLSKALVGKMDPIGDDWRDHVFSSSRIEGFLIEFTELCRWYMSREDDPETRAVIEEFAGRMSKALERRQKEPHGVRPKK